MPPASRPIVYMKSPQPNVFDLLNDCYAAATRHGMNDADLDRFTDEVSAAVDYNAALKVILAWFDVYLDAE